jgi:hypothetical protein
MRATCTMYVTKRGGVRITKGNGRAQSGEVAFRVTILIPDSVFIEPRRTITVNVSESIAEPVHIEADAAEIRPADPIEHEGEQYGAMAK